MKLYPKGKEGVWYLTLPSLPFFLNQFTFILLFNYLHDY